MTIFGSKSVLGDLRCESVHVRDPLHVLSKDTAKDGRCPNLDFLSSRVRVKMSRPAAINVSGDGLAGGGHLLELLVVVAFDAVRKRGVVERGLGRIFQEILQKGHQMR
jgi:hypothetical protein